MISPATSTFVLPRLLVETPSAPAKKSKFDFIIEFFQKLLGIPPKSASSTCVLSQLKAANALARAQNPEKYRRNATVRNGIIYEFFQRKITN
jgi:hypothetical protein